MTRAAFLVAELRAWSAKRDLLKRCTMATSVEVHLQDETLQVHFYWGAAKYTAKLEVSDLVRNPTDPAERWLLAEPRCRMIRKTAQVALQQRGLLCRSPCLTRRTKRW